MTCLQLLGAFHGAWMGIPEAVPTGKDLLMEPEQGPAAPVGQSWWKAAALCSFHSSCSLGCREGEGRKIHQKKIEVEGTGVVTAKPQEQELLKMLWDPRSGALELRGGWVWK